jgi:hypothetical protein
MASRTHTVTSGESMGLKAPGLLTFMFAVVLTVTVLIVHFFGGNVPLLKEPTHHFYVLLFAQVLLIAGCVTRGM